MLDTSSYKAAKCCLNCDHSGYDQFYDDCEGSRFCGKEENLQYTCDWYICDNWKLKENWKGHHGFY
jgi:hypothetical protein